jgi:hypothetical protein
MKGLKVFSFVCRKVLEFVDEHGNEVLNLGSFTLLPQHVVRLILAREELRADEFTKFQVLSTLVQTHSHLIHDASLLIFGLLCQAALMLL